jgi:hypothetical protein
LHEEGMIDKEKLIMKKYAKELEAVEGKWDIHPVIELYVKMGEIEQAWRLALKVNDSKQYPLYTLRNAFKEDGLHAEAEKAQAMIDKNLSSTLTA